MELNEGYSYRINIVSEDSNMLVDSYNSLLKGSVVNQLNEVIVDIENNRFNGTLLGHIIDRNFNLIIDVDQKLLSIDQIKSNNIQGKLYNSQNELVFDNTESTFNNINTLSSNSANILHLVTDDITVNDIWTKTVSANNAVHHAVSTNSLSAVDMSSVTLTVDKISVTDSITAPQFIGNLYNTDDTLVIDNGIIYARSIVNTRNEPLIIGSENTSDVNIHSKRINIATTAKSLDDDLGVTAIKFSFCNEGNGDSKNLKGNNFIGLINCEGYIDNEYKDIGMMGFLLDSYIEEDSETISSYFVVRADDGDMLPDQDNVTPTTSHTVFNQSLTFGKKTLSAPIFKVGSHVNYETINPQKGMILFNDTLGKFQGFTGSEWVDLH